MTVSNGVLKDGGEAPTGTEYPAQLVFLDWDGATADYRNPALGVYIPKFEIAPSGLTPARIAEITEILNGEFAEKNVVFVSRQPAEGEYSTVFIGKTGAFAEYGRFYGVAETIDTDNRNRHDNAFVLADSSWSTAEIAAVVSHEIGHIVQGISHGQTVGSLADFAAADIDFSTISGTQTISGTVEDSFSLRAGRTIRSQVCTLDIPAGQYVVVTVTGGTASRTGNAFAILTVHIGDQSFRVGSSGFTRTFKTSLNTPQIQIYVNAGGSSGEAYSARCGYTLTATFYNRTYQPKLRVASVSVNSAGSEAYKWSPQSTFQISFTIVNDGDTASDAGTPVRIYDGSILLGSVSLRSIAAFDAVGVSTRYTVEAGTLQVGTHTIRVEAGSSVMTKQISVTEAKLPDLTVSSLTVSRGGTVVDTADTDDEVTVGYTVRNIGTAAAAASRIALYDGETLLQTQSVAALGAESEVSGKFTIAANTLNVAEHRFRVVCDSRSEVNELNEDNNLRETELPVAAPKPNWSVASVFSTDRSFYLDSETVTADLRITNSGKVAAPAATGLIRTANSGKELGSFNIPALAAGASVTVTCSFAASQLENGQCGIVCEVNSENIPEQTDRDNEAAATFCKDAGFGNYALRYSNVAIGADGPDGRHDYVTSTDTQLNLDMYLYNRTSYIIPSGEARISIDGKQVSVGIIDPADTMLIPYLEAKEELLKGAYIELASLLTAGRHTLKVELDPENKVRENDETDNVYEYEFYVYGTEETIEKPDLVPYAKSAWGTPLVVAAAKGDQRDTAVYTVGQPMYVSWAAANLGTAPLYSNYLATLSVDGQTVQRWRGSRLGGNQLDSVTDYLLDGLAAGEHTLTLTVDTQEQIAEKNETNNSFSKTITVRSAAAETAGDLNADGRADIVMTIAQSAHPYDGATGAWLIDENQIPVWGDLSTRNAGWEIFGTGKTVAGKTTNDVYIKNTGNIVGAWTTDDDGKVNGWATVETFNADTQVVGLGDFNGNGQSDLLLRSENGAVGCFFTNGEGWNYFQSLGDEWKLSAIGDFNGDGRADVVLKHDAGFAGSWLTQADGTIAWADLDTLKEGFSIVGAGDFNGDGTDDVLLKKDTYYGAWAVQNGSAVGWFGLGDLGDVTVEQIADFDGDGRDDLRLRTTAGDLGAMLVKGEDSLVWKYYGSVGAEWNTAPTAL